MKIDENFDWEKIFLRFLFFEKYTIPFNASPEIIAAEIREHVMEPAEGLDPILFSSKRFDVDLVGAVDRSGFKLRATNYFHWRHFVRPFLYGRFERGGKSTLIHCQVALSTISIGYMLVFFSLPILAMLLSCGRAMLLGSIPFFPPCSLFIFFGMYAFYYFLFWYDAKKLKRELQRILDGEHSPYFEKQ